MYVCFIDMVTVSDMTLKAELHGNMSIGSRVIMEHTHTCKRTEGSKHRVLAYGQIWISVIISPLNAKHNTAIWVCTDEYSNLSSTGQYESQIRGRRPKFTSGKLLPELHAKGHRRLNAMAQNLV